MLSYKSERLGRLIVASSTFVSRPSTRVYRGTPNGCRARSTLSKIWVPTGGVSAIEGESKTVLQSQLVTEVTDN